MKSPKSTAKDKWLLQAIWTQKESGEKKYRVITYPQNEDINSANEYPTIRVQYYEYLAQKLIILLDNYKQIKARIEIVRKFYFRTWKLDDYNKK